MPPVFPGDALPVLVGIPEAPECREHQPCRLEGGLFLAAQQGMGDAFDLVHEREDVIITEPVFHGISFPYGVGFHTNSTHPQEQSGNKTRSSPLLGGETASLRGVT